MANTFPVLRRSARAPLISAIATSATFSPAWAQPSDHSNWSWHMHGGAGRMMGWGGTMYGGIGMLFFWGIILVLIILLARAYMGVWPSRVPPQSSHSGSNALGILKERYAKGEISKEEYLEYKRTLAD